MARSDAANPEAYLAEQEADRRAELSRVRDLVNAALPAGYREGMGWGMIGWVVPLEVSGPTYNKQPLVYAGLAAQKNYNSLYLNCVYSSAERTERLKAEAAAAGKPLNMGKSCIRFKRADDLPLDLIRREIASTPPEAFVAIAKAALGR